jgi:hypothetical protein
MEKPTSERKNPCISIDDDIEVVGKGAVGEEPCARSILIDRYTTLTVGRDLSLYK